MTDGIELVQLHPDHRPLPASDEETELVRLYLDRSGAPRSGLHAADPARPWVRANMVATLDGAVTGADQRSGSISSPADKRVFSVLRSLADAVIVGAGTARAERYTRLHAKHRHAQQRRGRGQDAAPLLVLVSRSGQADLDRLDEAGSGGVVVHATRDHCGPARRAELIERLGEDAVVLHDHEVEARAVLDDLRRRECREIVHEGGPALLGAWIGAGAVDELCLTTSPLLVGAPDPEAPRGLLDGYAGVAPVPLSLLSLVSDGSTLIQRWGLPLEQTGVTQYAAGSAEDADQQ